ncbi:MAG: DUF4405 domain-containing protein [Synergistales bacterium]
MALKEGTLLNRKALIKMVVDLLMILFLLGAMAYRLTGNKGHELMGVSLLALLILHNGLNWRWYPGIPKGRYDSARFLNTGINLLLLVATLGVMMTGIALSQDLFAFLGLRGGLLARKLHLGFAYWMFVLSSIHLGMHWSMITRVVKKTAGWRVPKSSDRLMILDFVGIVVVLYGIYAFYERELTSKLLFSQAYDFWDYSGGALSFFADYLSVMVLFVYATHLVLNRLGNAPDLGKVVR